MLTDKDGHLGCVEESQEPLWDDLEHSSLESPRLLGDLDVQAVIRHEHDVLHAVLVCNGDLGSIRDKIDRAGHSEIYEVEGMV